MNHTVLVGSGIGCTSCEGDPCKSSLRLSQGCIGFIGLKHAVSVKGPELLLKSTDVSRGTWHPGLPFQ